MILHFYLIDTEEYGSYYIKKSVLYQEVVINFVKLLYSWSKYWYRVLICISPTLEKTKRVKISPFFFFPWLGFLLILSLFLLTLSYLSISFLVLFGYRIFFAYVCHNLVGFILFTWSFFLLRFYPFIDILDITMLSYRFICLSVSYCCLSLYCSQYFLHYLSAILFVVIRTVVLCILV